MFQASSAACTFARAVSSVNGGTGGRIADHPPRAATDCHSVTWTFGRAWEETAPARPVEIAWVASGVVAKRCSASAAGSARPRPSVRRVPHLDDRGAADVQPHQRAAADLVDDGVRERQHDALAGRGRGDRGRAAAVGGDRAASGRGGRRRAPVAVVGSSSGWPISQRSPAERRRREPARRRQRMARRGDDDQPAAQERRAAIVAARPGAGRARCPRAGAPAPRRTRRRARSRPRPRAPRRAR